MDIAPLKSRNAGRNNPWSTRFEEELDPWFGLDWSRGLARTIAVARTGASPSDAQIDVRSSDRLAYVRDVGYPVPRLEYLLYFLARANPGQLYVGSVNAPSALAVSEGTPTLRQHHHVVILLPYFDAGGAFRVAVMERNLQTSLASLTRRYGSEYVHLVRIDAEGSFSPPKSEKNSNRSGETVFCARSMSRGELNKGPCRSIISYSMKFSTVCFLLLLCGAGLVAAVPAAAAPAENDLFAEAESRYLGKNYTAALESYDAFAAAYPLSERIADVQYRRAVCLYRLDRYRDAVQLIGDIEVRYRTTRYFSFVPLWKGLSLYGLKSYSLCVDSLDKFLAGPADAEFTPQALLHKALAQQALSDDAAARESLVVLTSATSPRGFSRTPRSCSAPSSSARARSSSFSPLRRRRIRAGFPNPGRATSCSFARKLSGDPTAPTRLNPCISSWSAVPTTSPSWRTEGCSPRPSTARTCRACVT